MSHDARIDKERSKLEITRRIIEGEIDLPVPVSAWLYSGQSLNSIRSQFEAMRKPVIVRGSTDRDYFADIDVAPTKRDVHSFSKLEQAIKDAELFMQSPEVQAHCEDWGLPYTPEINFLIQEQSPSPILGSMIRNPHTGKIHVEYEDVTQSLSVCRDMKSFADCAGSKLTHHSFLGISNDEIMALIRTFELAEQSGLLDGGYDHQMEFGLQPLLVFQLRVFKKKEPAADFEIPDYRGISCN